jgi:demethylmenaquinone methyltransferase/2-methoxy-6-polyprenyl-1,4-benzoquinol methylase
MNTETFSRTKPGHLLVKILASAMESRFRYRFFSPVKTLEGINDLRGMNVLEIGCGTGFFTIPAAGLIGEQGSLVSMDILQESVDFVSGKVAEAGLANVRVIRGNALRTDLPDQSFQIVILFGIIPAPMIPLKELMKEIHRLLIHEGTLAVWPPVPGISRSVLKTGLFSYISKKNGVCNFKCLYETSV